ncbi:MAG: hypothetical protein KR126chlam4_01090 [Candidatus Anoxychlamydiales bacterium]|nr:hypothetical protein [Candidatus Anoxychlamydiales bacterium]
MTNTQANEKEKIAEEKKYSEKKPLKDVLSSYLEKKQNEKSIKKIKKDLSELKLNFTKAKTSFETLIEVQKKLNLAYNNISDAKNGEKKQNQDN